MVPKDMDTEAAEIYGNSKFLENLNHERSYNAGLGCETMEYFLRMREADGSLSRIVLKMQVEFGRRGVKATLFGAGKQIVSLHTDHLHTNPDRLTIPRPHKHYQKNGASRWAYHVNDPFDMKDPTEVFHHFCNECNVEEGPFGQMFMPYTGRS